MIQMTPTGSAFLGCSSSVSASVTVSLAEVVPLLLHASQNDRGWLNDFADDVVQVSEDLYEILVAYQDLIMSRATGQS